MLRDFVDAEEGVGGEVKGETEVKHEGACIAMRESYGGESFENADAEDESGGGVCMDGEEEVVGGVAVGVVGGRGWVVGVGEESGGLGAGDVVLTVDGGGEKVGVGEGVDLDGTRGEEEVGNGGLVRDSMVFVKEGDDVGGGKGDMGE